MTDVPISSRTSGKRASKGARCRLECRPWHCRAALRAGRIGMPYGRALDCDRHPSWCRRRLCAHRNDLRRLGRGVRCAGGALFATQLAKPHASERRSRPAHTAGAFRANCRGVRHRDAGGKSRTGTPPVTRYCEGLGTTMSRTISSVNGRIKMPQPRASAWARSSSPTVRMIRAP